MKLQPENFGVMLRRKPDYQFHNQRAEVSIADASKESQKMPISNPPAFGTQPGRIPAFIPIRRKNSARRSINCKRRTADFATMNSLVPVDLTKGRSAIRVRVKFTPVETPISHVTKQEPPVERLWSEIRYDAYCYQMPKFEAPRSNRRTAHRIVTQSD